MKITGIVLIVLQLISLIPSLATGENIFQYGFPNLFGRFALGIIGIILLVISLKKKNDKK